MTKRVSISGFEEMVNRPEEEEHNSGVGSLCSLDPPSLESMPNSVSSSNMDLTPPRANEVVPHAVVSSSCLPARERTDETPQQKENTLLPLDYTPTQHDVIFGGSGTYHGGNAKFNQLIEHYAAKMNTSHQNNDLYVYDQTAISQVLHSVHDKGGKFIFCDNGFWHEASDEIARVKISHSFRDMRQSRMEQTRDLLHCGTSKDEDEDKVSPNNMEQEVEQVEDGEIVEGDCNSEKEDEIVDAKSSETTVVQPQTTTTPNEKDVLFDVQRQMYRSRNPQFLKLTQISSVSYKSKGTEEREKICTMIQNCVRFGGGRFLCKTAVPGEWEEMTGSAPKRLIAFVLKTLALSQGEQGTVAPEVATSDASQTRQDAKLVAGRENSAAENEWKMKSFSTEEQGTVAPEAATSDVSQTTQNAKRVAGGENSAAQDESKMESSEQSRVLHIEPVPVLSSSRVAQEAPPPNEAQSETKNSSSAWKEEIRNEQETTVFGAERELRNQASLCVTEPASAPKNTLFIDPELVPSEKDVICGCNPPLNHPGTKDYFDLIMAFAELYQRSAKSKKSAIIAAILNNHKGKFVFKKLGSWKLVNDVCGKIAADLINFDAASSKNHIKPKTTVALSPVQPAANHENVQTMPLHPHHVSRRPSSVSPHQYGAAKVEPLCSIQISHHDSSSASSCDKGRTEPLPPRHIFRKQSSSSPRQPRMTHNHVQTGPPSPLNSQQRSRNLSATDLRRRAPDGYLHCMSSFHQATHAPYPYYPWHPPPHPFSHWAPPVRYQHIGQQSAVSDCPKSTITGKLLSHQEKQMDQLLKKYSSRAALDFDIAHYEGIVESAKDSRDVAFLEIAATAENLLPLLKELCNHEKYRSMSSLYAEMISLNNALSRVVDIKQRLHIAKKLEYIKKRYKSEKNAYSQYCEEGGTASSSMHHKNNTDAQSPQHEEPPTDSNYAPIHVTSSTDRAIEILDGDTEEEPGQEHNHEHPKQNGKRPQRHKQLGGKKLRFSEDS